MDHVPIDLGGQEADRTTLELRSRGPWPLPDCPRVAIVGTRQPMHYGETIAKHLAHDLARTGVLVISGLSQGIEAVAHQAALDAGGGTVAVLSTGVDVIHPVVHADLAERILSAGGTLLSAFPDGTRHRTANVRRRYWTLAGLADIVVVVEAFVNSICLTAAVAARALDKTVMAVPGNVFSSLSYGCHQLIRDGASMVESATDVLATLPMDRPARASLSREDIRVRLINAELVMRDAQRRLAGANAQPGQPPSHDSEGRTPAEAYHYWGGVVAAYSHMLRQFDVRRGRS
jgi:DNA protecting protein DprA